MEDLVLWLMNRHKELEMKMQIVTGGEISFFELNKRMAEYGGDYAFAITEDIVTEHAYRRKQLEYEAWYNTLFTIAKNALPSGSSVKAIEALIATENPADWKKWKELLLQLELQKNARSQFLRVWSALKDIYVEIARNMRADWNTAGGISISDTGQEKVGKIKRLRRLKE